MRNETEGGELLSRHIEKRRYNFVCRDSNAHAGACNARVTARVASIITSRTDDVFDEAFSDMLRQMMLLSALRCAPFSALKAEAE